MATADTVTATEAAAAGIAETGCMFNSAVSQLNDTK
jgi:hypothetical protein